MTDIEGLDKVLGKIKNLPKHIEKEMEKALFATGLRIEGEAKQSILSGAKTGKVYKRRSVEHQASAPGEAPASDTGRLANSINTSEKGGEVEVRASTGYAGALEFGTTKIEKRPYMKPATEKTKSFKEKRIKDALKKGIKNGTR